MSTVRHKRLVSSSEFSFRSLSLRAVALGAGFVIAYLLLDWISDIHPMPTYKFTPWNPQPALAIALLFIAGQRAMPVVFAAVLASEFVVRGGWSSLFMTAAVAAVLTLGYAAIARALTGRFSIKAKLDSARDIVRLIAVVMAGVLITGLLYVGALYAGGIGRDAHQVDAILRFWVGNSIGVLVTLPLLLMPFDADRRRQFRDTLFRKETLAQGVAMGLVLWVVFGLAPPTEEFKYFYLLFLPLIWIAARSGMVGTALGAAIIQTAVILEVQAVEYRAITVFELQALLIALTITGFYLGATVEERERAAADLRRSLKLAAAGEMAAAITHELNQPLTALSSYAKASQLLVASPDRGGQQLVDTLEKVVGQSKRAADVVRRLRDFFQTGASEVRRIALSTLVTECLHDLGPRLAARNISARLRGVDEIPDLMLDPFQIEVVLRNLILNAVEAMENTPEDAKAVDIEIRSDGAQKVLVTVDDTGPGIDAARADALFEPFVTTKASGMGMGLAISRAIVEAHGGTLWIEPSLHGRLCFTLPLSHGPDDPNH